MPTPGNAPGHSVLQTDASTWLAWTAMGYPTGIDPVLPLSQSRVQATTLRTPRAGDVRIELTTSESKSGVIPFHQSPTNHTETHWDFLEANYHWNNPLNQCVFVW